MKREIRRKDRVLEDEAALDLLLTAEFGYLSMVNVDGGGYGIPISYAYDNMAHIYFHSAPEGHKLLNLDADNRVTFTVVGKTTVIPHKFTTEYESVMIYGNVEVVTDEQERFEALLLLVEKYSPEHRDLAEKYIRASFNRTAILRLDIQHFTAKAKVLDITKG